jgi:Protein of unknown function (DUF2726)
MQQTLPWIIALAVLATAAAALAVWALRPRRPMEIPLPTSWSLTPRPVFSTDERRVYRQLREALPHHIVLAKLPLVRFCQPADPDEVRYWYELLGAIHVTFAICSANGRVLAAIDLDTERGSSRRAQQIKQNMLSACRIRYLRCAADHLPSVPELQLLVPQTSPTARGPQAAPMASQIRDTLASTVATRRRERTALWQESGFFQDSFFGIDNLRDSGPTSTFGSHFGDNLRPPRELGPTTPPPDDAGGVVVESARAASPTRH